MDWRHHAICREEAPELFFPIGNTGPALIEIEEAKSVCRRCPVMEQCGRWALESGQEYGVWGGLTEDERHDIWRRRAVRRQAGNHPPATAAA
jgi:WhiB family transcriptional regulator, redox-sensing transcriptional regulator